MKKIIIKTDFGHLSSKSNIWNLVADSSKPTVKSSVGAIDTHTYTITGEYFCAHTSLAYQTHNKTPEEYQSE